MTTPLASRRQWLQAATGAWAAPATRPNVLLVLADQYPAYATGYNGDPFARTPHLDGLAREGARFVNAVSNCPVCTPYRAMLQTGRWPLTTGMVANDLRLPERELTLAEVFGDAGYQTAYIGKWHLDGPERWAFTPPGPRRQGYGFWAVNNCNHNESVNVPFVLRYPRRVRAGLAPEATLDAVDVMPTLLSLAGIAPPKSVQGRDLSGALAARSTPGGASLLAGYMPFARQAFDYPEWRAVRTAAHTYVETRQGPLHLFANRQDPYQLTDLVNRPAQAELQAGLARRLRALLAGTGDRFEPRQAYWKRYNLEIGDFGQVRYSTAAPRSPGG